MGPFLFDTTNRENHEQYSELLDRLSADHKPVGAAEELEVQRIAVCWWKLGRVQRYENAAITAGLADVEVRYEQRMHPNTISSEDQARLVLLRNAESEIESTDTISAELREKMFANDPEFRKQWESLEKAVRENVTGILSHLRFSPSDAEQCAQDPSFILFFTTYVAIYMIEHRDKTFPKKVLEIAADGVAVLREEALDRVLRAEAAAERNLSRAMDRLERLQRHRQGESVPPPVNVRLTR